MAKVLRAELPKGLQPDSYLNADPSETCDSLHGLLISLLRLTPRVNKTILQSAVTSAFPKQASEAASFALHVTAAISYCRQVEKSTSTGKKLSDGVKKVVKWLARNKASKGLPQPPSSWGGLGKQAERQQEMQQKQQSPPPRSSIAQRLRRRALEKQRSEASSPGAKAQSPEPPSPPSPKRAKQTPASSSTATRAEVFALYGLSTQQTKAKACKLPVDSDVLSIASSPEAPKGQQVQLEFVDSSKAALVRIMQDGSKVEAEMFPCVETGFLKAKFPGESKLIETEIPNLMKVKTLQKKPAASQKPGKGQKRKRNQKSKKPKHEEEEDEEAEHEESGEDEEAEDAEEDAGAAAENEDEAEEEIEATKKPDNFWFQSKTWSKMKAEFYSEKSYIRVLDPETNKLKLVIMTAGPDHWAKLQKLVQHAKKSNMSKEKLATIRSSL